MMDEEEKGKVVMEGGGRLNTFVPVGTLGTQG
jgi:hypothetical protein